MSAHPGFRRTRFLLLGICLSVLAGVGLAAPEPVYIGFDGAYGQKTSTAAPAIERGVRAALEDINRRGGVFGGRPLKLITTDNQGVSARGRDNFIALAQKKDLVAVLGGKFSPVTVEVLPHAQALKLPIISVWGSADPITDHADHPSYAFRLSLKDSWGVEAMMAHAVRRYRAKTACALVPNTSWGRSGEAVIKARAAALNLKVPLTHWYNWGDQSFARSLVDCERAGAQAILMIANEREAAVLLKDIAALPPERRLPVVSHWGVTGGVLHELAGEALSQVRFEVIQTFSFVGNRRPQARALAAWLMVEGGFSSAAAIPSPVGSAHAYDMTQLLAMAVNRAGSTRREAVRDALEHLPAYDGVVRRYARPFTPERHDALDAGDVLFVRVEPSGALLPIERR